MVSVRVIVSLSIADAIVPAVIVPPKDDVIVPKRKPKAPSTPSYSHPSAGVGAQASIDTSGKFAGKGTGNPWGRAKGGLIRKKYGDGGIVDLL